MSEKRERKERKVKLNVINEPKESYSGGKSSLCPGCGHDQISSVIISAAWENGVEPHKIAKMSGIGCSSKTPAYYLGQSHGFNTVHGRMPSVTTGAYAVNKDLLYIGVSGDGDSASIGIGQLIHAIRRNMDMVYIVENNGVYGLTKGQYSATADIGSKKKDGSFAKCGRSKQKADAKRKYPKCVPLAKATRMSDSQRASAVKRKRAAGNTGPKPTNVKTFAKRKSMSMGGLV